MDDTEYRQCCLPRYLRRLVDTHQDGYPCPGCGQTSAEDGTPRLAQTMTYRCTNRANRGRIHFFQLVYCSGACSRAFRERLATDGYGGCVLLLPFSPEALAADAMLAQSVSQQLVMTRPWPVTSGSRCENCTARHLEGTPKFKMCSRCKGPRYCSGECQAEHWKAGHQKACGRPPPKILSVPLVDPAVLVATELREEREHAECFDTATLAQRRAGREGVCSRPTCGRPVAGPVQLHFVTIECRSPDKPQLHLTPLAYCSAKCRNRDSRGRVGYDSSVDRV